MDIAHVRNVVHQQKAKKMNPCKWDVEMGKIIEFIEGMKGFKATLFTIALAIILQVGTFLYLWGGLTTKVSGHDKSLSSICAKLDKIQLIGYVCAEEDKQ
jgi:hypothetical protein